MSDIQNEVGSFKFYADKSKAKRALKNMGEKALAAAEELLVRNPANDKQWGFSTQAVEAINNPPAPAAPAAPVAPVFDMTSGLGRMAAQLYNVGNPVETKKEPRKAAKKVVATSKIEKNRPEQNGVKRPSAGGLCRSVWDALDDLREKNNAVPTSTDVKLLAEANNWNPNNASIEYYQWRKFNGIVKAKKS